LFIVRRGKEALRSTRILHKFRSWASALAEAVLYFLGGPRFWSTILAPGCHVTSSGIIFYRSIVCTVHVAAVVVPVSLFAPFHQTPTTPVRKICGGSPKVYNPLKTDPERFEPVEVDPDEAKPSIPAEDKPRNSPAPAPSPMNSPPTKLYPSPQKRVPAPIPRTPAETAARSSFVPTPVIQPVPIPGSLPGPATWNNLKPQRSIPTLLSVS